jgi:hypothetical protein
MGGTNSGPAIVSNTFDYFSLLRPQEFPKPVFDPLHRISEIWVWLGIQKIREIGEWVSETHAGSTSSPMLP